MPTLVELETTFNPYPSLGTQFNAGLDYIIANLTTGEIDDLATQVTTYVYGLGLLPSTTTVQTEISSIAYSSVNGYLNGQKSNYSGAQLAFINRLTGKSFTSGLTVDSLSLSIWFTQDAIIKSGLSVEQQTPLLLATSIGIATYNYWISQITSGTSAWNSYFSDALTSATANVPFWNAAAMQGALIGARSTFKGMIEQTTQIVTVEMVSALTAALMIGAGKVIFTWTPRMSVGMAGSAGCGCH